MRLIDYIRTVEPGGMAGLSARTGIHRTDLWKLSRGRGGFTVRNVARIKAATGGAVDPNSIFEAFEQAAEPVNETAGLF